MSNYSIKVVDNLSDFEGLKGVWNKLAYSDKEYFPFLCFEWFEVWLRHFLEDHKILILLLFQESDIVAIAPFLIKKERYKKINIIKIELMGNVYSPIRYFLFKETNHEARKGYIASIYDFFFRSYKSWDILDLYSLPEENEHYDVFETAIRLNAIRYSNYFCFGDWYLDGINFSGDEYSKKFSSKFRHNLKYRLKELQEKGCLEFRVITNEEDTIDHYMDMYYDVYSRSWQKRENIGPTFHRDLAKLAIRKGWLRLGLLFLDGYPIATQFWLSCNNIAYILKTVYDKKYKIFSPGKILTLHMFKYAIDNDRVTTIDYVQGDELYKKDWTPQRRERKEIIVYNDSMKGRYLHFVNNTLLPLLKKSKYVQKFKDFVVSQRKRSQ